MADSSSESNTSGIKWTYHHPIVFFLTFFGYSLFHATRKTFSNVKTTISDEWSPTNFTSDVFDNETWNSHKFFPTPQSSLHFLADLDTTFMGAYAMGLYLSGILGDRLNMRIVFSVGMWLSAITLFIFGTLSEWLQIYNKTYYVSFWLLNGICQSSGWPVAIAVMGNWFGKSSRGLVFGIWGACTSVGNIIGSYLVAAVIGYGYQWAFFVPACLLFAGGIVIFCCLIPSPQDLGLPLPDKEYSNEETNVDDLEGGSEEKLVPTSTRNNIPIPIWQAVCLPGVLPYSLAYACLKMVNYSFFFWLPYYLGNNFHWGQAESDIISIWYDVGGIIGAVVSGLITDRMERRSPTVMVMLIISPITLLIYRGSPDDTTTNAVLMALVGIFVNGAANIISTAVTADLGRQPVLKGNSRALATVTGIIDGTGSLGAAFGMLIIPVLREGFGWSSVFYLFIAMMVLTAFCITPIFIHDAQFYYIKLRQRFPTPINASEETQSDIRSNRLR